MSKVLGISELQLTTHSMRRSGASELSALGVAKKDVMDFGRWASDRAAQEYIRRGEVGLFRAGAAVAKADWLKAQSLARLGSGVWKL